LSPRGERTIRILEWVTGVLFVATIVLIVVIVVAALNYYI